ncbi:MAG TPA: S41 family peptidase [Caldimonas sp.]
MRFLVLVLLTTLLLDARANDIGDACLADLDALPDFLVTNDAGARDNAVRLQDVLGKAFEHARALAREATGDDDCAEALRTYLRAFRHGHLAIAPIRPGGADAFEPPTMSDPMAPRFRVLGTNTALLTLPTFGDRYASLIDTLVAEHRQEIVSRPYLIVDVRRNGGGSDASYAPLLPLFAANITRTIGAEFLATADNIAASQAVCKLPATSTEACRKFMTPVIEAMRAAPAGTYVLPDSERAVDVETPEHVLENPRRIAVLIDHACGSSCEEFVLAVRQSFKVKTFGRPTYGSLDYSNLRPHDLPSGRRRLFYATSRSLRLPLFPVDAAGIAPDQFLPPPANEAAFDAEIETVRRILEFEAAARTYRRRR